MIREKDDGRKRGLYSFGSPYVTDTVGKYQRELALLLSESPLRIYKSGEILFDQGDIGNRFYFIKKGKVMATMSNQHGAVKIVAIHASNSFIGDTALGQHSHYATGVTLQESEVHVIENSHFESCVKRHPKVAFLVIESLLRKACNAALQLEDLSLRNAKQRVAHVLIELSNEIGRETDVGVEIEEKMTHEILAGLTGLARPTLTGVLNDLERSNVIIKKNRLIIIIDEKKLSHILD